MSTLKQLLRRVLGRPQSPTIGAQHPFDLEHGVHTSGLLEAQHLRTGHANDASNTAYFGVPPSRFCNAIEQWRITEATLPVERYRLLDIGCGKGRAVLLASRMNFRDVVGVELNPALAAAARANLEHWQQARATVATTILCADAPTALTGLLDWPVLLYVYNPFRAPVLRQMLQAVQTHSQGLNGWLDILYLYPEHEDVFWEFPAFQRLWQRHIPLAPKDEGDGISAATDPCSLYRLLPTSNDTPLFRRP